MDLWLPVNSDVNIVKNVGKELLGLLYNEIFTLDKNQQGWIGFLIKVYALKIFPFKIIVIIQLFPL